MRYADGPRAECEVLVAAAPCVVWELVSDIGLPARTSPELQRVEWLDGASGPVVGARFAGFNNHPKIGDWRTVSQVVECDEERAFAWAVIDVDGRFGHAVDDPAQALATWRFTLEPEGNGTRLRHSVRVGPGSSGLSSIIARMPEKEEQLIAARLAELRTGIEATLNGVKSLAETGR
ncbi:SRPBCC family protein [Streptomyces sp. ET3-23]|uniref:SRPBCC family protein n=1 Tax=Streptomyces sp. ET3-23 TaxID=2885643 RepID=UPI001D1159FD|nr:SRPBCC family protein [Streptomyces sp. ET3-23]MCC2274217.1 SRPBCC family protein [Streptomyces sp. ET3-23]